MDFEISKDPLHIGTAAEHLVCADIWARGFPATMAPQACPYDIIAQMPAGLVKIQVKATVKPMRSFERHSFENAFSKWVKHGE